MAHNVPDRSVLAGRIQGFGNVNPPPLEDETGKDIAKKAVGRLGDMVGEEVMLTVEDFREKGAVGAVKDAVADAGDILIDGVSGLIGWIRGDPPPEDDEEAEKAEDATKALSNGPAGAAYGISQASPTGGINAVWVMPDEADPATLAMLTTQAGAASGLAAQQADPRVPKNIQPYEPAAGRGGASRGSFAPPGAPMHIPGGPTIAPYTPAPSGPAFSPYTPMPAGGRPPPFVPGAGPGFPAAAAAPRWGPSPGAFNPASGAGSASASSSAPAPAPAGAKALIERMAKGEVIVGPDSVKRLVSQCQATKTSGKQVADMICERARRLYLGLDGGDPSDADAALARLLGLVDELQRQPSSDLTTSALQEVRKGVVEEFTSLRSSAKHKDEAEPMLQRLLNPQAATKAAAAAPVVDLLGGDDTFGSSSGSGAPPPAAQADLLGESDPTPAPAAAASTAAAIARAAEPDLLADAAPTSSADVGVLDAVLSAPVASLPEPASPAGELILAGLDLDSPPAATAVSPQGAANAAAMPGTMGAGARLPREDEMKDAFSFVGDEISKAGARPS